MADTNQPDRPVEEVPTTCTTCNANLDPAVWHPTRTTKTDDGDVILHAFCDDGCLAEWDEGEEPDR